MDYDFIVIGGGICGLQIAALCSKLGKVIVLEKTSHIGGRARVINKDGFLLDWGGHPVRFGKKSAIAQTMRDVGFEIEFLDPGISYIYLKNDTKHIYPTGIKGILKSKMISKIELIKIILKLIRNYKKNPTQLMETSIRSFIAVNNISESLAMFLQSASASMQVNPFLDRSSMGEFYLNLMRVIKNKSVFYPRGGWSVFFNNLEKVITQNGEIRTSSKVEEIVIENNRAKGVKVKGEIISAANIISTIPIQTLFDIVDMKYASNEMVAKYKNLRCTAGLCIDFCLDERITDDILFFFEEPSAFGLCTSNLSPEVAPEGKSILYFFAPSSKEIIENKQKREELEKSLLETICKTYPNIEEHTEYKRVLFLNMVDGVEIAIDQYEGIRPDGKELNIKNLYLTGDSIGGEGAGGDVGHTSVRKIFKKIKSDFQK